MLLSPDNIRPYRQHLLGKIHQVCGNHDRRTPDYDAFSDSVHDLTEVKVQLPSGHNQLVVLCHYAMRGLRSSFRGAWHLFGHSHGGLPDDPHALILDIGVDCWDFRPVSVAEIARRMAQKTWPSTYGPAAKARAAKEAERDTRE